jgi:hypothetical protein
VKELVRAEARQGRRHIAPGDETFFAVVRCARDLRDHAQREEGTGRRACGGAPAHRLRLALNESHGAGRSGFFERGVDEVAPKHSENLSCNRGGPYSGARPVISEV